MDEKTAINQYQTFELDDEEIIVRKEMLLKELDNIDVINADFDSQKKRFQSELKQSETNVGKLREAIKTKCEMFRVDIYYNDPYPGQKRTVREDTEESVTEFMTEEEKKKYSQINIFKG